MINYNYYVSIRHRHEKYNVHALLYYTISYFIIFHTRVSHLIDDIMILYSFSLVSKYLMLLITYLYEYQQCEN